MAQTGDIKYFVEFCPAEYGQALHDDGEWPGDHMKNGVTLDFRVAERAAIKAAKNDYFGCASITRYQCENPKYDWWEQTGFWEVMPDASEGDLDPDHPDHI